MKKVKNSTKIFFALGIGVFLLPQMAFAEVFPAESLLGEINKQRLVQSCPILEINPKLQKAAEQKALDILEKQNFNHNFDNKNFSDWAREQNYDYSFVGENLAIDFFNEKEVVRAWMNSDEHKKNILSPYYDETGIAILEGTYKGEKTVLTVQIFGSSRQDSITSPTNDFEKNNLFKLSNSSPFPGYPENNSGLFFSLLIFLGVYPFLLFTSLQNSHLHSVILPSCSCHSRGGGNPKSIHGTVKKYKYR